MFVGLGNLEMGFLIGREVLHLLTNNSWPKILTPFSINGYYEYKNIFWIPSTFYASDLIAIYVMHSPPSIQFWLEIWKLTLSFNNKKLEFFLSFLWVHTFYRLQLSTHRTHRFRPKTLKDQLVCIIFKITRTFRLISNIRWGETHVVSGGDRSEIL